MGTPTPAIRRAHGTRPPEPADGRVQTPSDPDGIRSGVTADRCTCKVPNSAAPYGISPSWAEAGRRPSVARPGSGRADAPRTGREGARGAAGRDARDTGRM